MPSEVKMSVDERRKYLKLVAVRYAKSGKRERGELLTEMGTVTGLHRKSLARLMTSSSLERAPRRPNSKGGNGAAVADVVRVVWESLDYVCAKADYRQAINSARFISLTNCGAALFAYLSTID